MDRGGIIIKKNKKVAKLLNFGLYNIIGSKWNRNDFIMCPRAHSRVYLKTKLNQLQF